MTTYAHANSHGSHRRIAVSAVVAALISVAALHAAPQHGSVSPPAVPGPQSTTELIARFR